MWALKKTLKGTWDTLTEFCRMNVHNQIMSNIKGTGWTDGCYIIHNRWMISNSGRASKNFTFTVLLLLSLSSVTSKYKMCVCVSFLSFFFSFVLYFVLNYYHCSHQFNNSWTSTKRVVGRFSDILTYLWCTAFYHHSQEERARHATIFFNVKQGSDLWNVICALILFMWL